MGASLAGVLGSLFLVLGLREPLWSACGNDQREATPLSLPPTRSLRRGGGGFGRIPEVVGFVLPGAALLRSLGVAAIGSPKSRPPGVDFLRGMDFQSVALRCAGTGKARSNIELV